MLPPLSGLRAALHPCNPALLHPLPCPAFLLLYANGKSAVRVDAPGVRQMGPHFFAGDASPR